MIYTPQRQVEVYQDAVLDEDKVVELFKKNRKYNPFKDYVSIFNSELAQWEVYELSKS